MRRHLPRLVLTGALLSPMSLYALGLGEIRLSSALNQPFDAEIELISPTSEELSSLKVSLASNELFSRYGIDRPAYLSNFNFSVSRTRDGRAAIKVTSNRSVTEPFVTILVEASWARGRLVREYTVLLDPPVFMPSQTEAPAPVTSAQSGAQTEGRIQRQQTPAPAPQPEQPAQQQQTAPAAAREAPSSASASAEQPAATIGGEYTVERNDTLWRIASAANPGPRRVVNQTMIALFRANPAAFDGNINKLRAGSVLRVPNLAEIEAVSTNEARAEVARQAAEWSGATPTQAVAEADRLRLVTPAETPTAPTAAAPTTATQPAAERPSAAPQGATTARDKRLEVTNPNLADVQRNVGETPAQAPVPEAQQQPAGQPAATTETPAPTAEEPAQAAPTAQAPAKPVDSQPPGPTLMERSGQYWWVLIVAGLALVVALVFAAIRRRREESAASLDSLSSIGFEPHVDRAGAAAATAAVSRDRADSFLVEDDEAADDYVEPPPAAATARRTEVPKPRPFEAQPAAPVAAPKAEDTLSSETAVRFDQQDALAEADFHMAYGLYDQAADLVKIAIDREPSRRDLKLKLLEIYFVWGNKDLFLDTARDLHGSRGAAAAGEWDKVLIMGKQIAPDDAMFKGEAGAARVDLVDVNLEGGENRVDVDLFAEPEGDGASGPAGLDLEFTSGERKAPSAMDAELTQAAESDLDFLLDEPSDGSGRGADDEPTRELDPLARTQETPTIESPAIDRSSQTLREKTDKALFSGQGAKPGTDQTAELSLDDLGLDVDSLEHTGSLEDTTSLEKDSDDGEPDVDLDTAMGRSLRDDEMTQLAPSLSSFDRTLESPRVVEQKFDIESTGTIYIDQVDLSGGGDTVEQQRPDVDSTASMKSLSGFDADVDLDLDHLSGAPGSTDSTLRHEARGTSDADRFSNDVFTDRTSEVPSIDLDVGEPLLADDHEPTNKQLTTEMELSELEPVTMSEVGTKLDLARAYMDMGDPDGARSILEEVLAEGNPNQKQEAQRLIESIR